MENNMKTKWGILAGVAAIVLAVAGGCDTDGGSSGDAGAGTTNKPVIVQICFSVPDCSASTPALFNGAAFGGGAGYLYIAPNCANTNDSTYVWIKVVSDLSPSTVDHFVWTIRNWTGAAPDGIFDNFDEVLDTNGVFKVRTSLDQIRYISAAAADLEALTELFNQQIDVTVVAKDGQVTSGYIALKLHNGTATGAQLVFGSLQSLDNFSQFRPGSFADYYAFTNTAATNVVSMEGDFATTLVLYDTNLNGVATNEGLFSGSVISEITASLAPNTPYVVEATSANDQDTGSYSILNNSDPLQPIPNPFVSGGQCDDISGVYTVTEILTLTLQIQGQSFTLTNVSSDVTTLVQNGCDFAYRVNDPTGVIPPNVRMGRLDFTTIDLYNDAYLPQCPDIFITSSVLVGNGRVTAAGVSIDSSGTLTGTFLGVPFTVDFVSQASFVK
jgi:hypothetical protein